MRTLDPPADRAARARPAALALVIAAACARPARRDAAVPPLAPRPEAPAGQAAPGAEGEDPAQQPPAAEEGAASRDEPGLSIHGSLRTRYRGRFTDDAQDQDLYETLVLDVGDERRDPYTAHAMGRISADLDGRTDFPSLADTTGDSLVGQLFEGYVDLERPPKPLARLRFGRQIDYRTPELAWFDGLQVESAPRGSWKLSGGAYGGVPVRLYEAWSLGDAMLGGWAQAWPWTGGRARLDWMHVEDDDRFGGRADDLFAGSLWQRLGERARFDGTYTRLEGHDRDLRLRATWDDPRRDLVVQAAYYRLLRTQNDFVEEFDPFFNSLQSYSPFVQYRLSLSKGLSEHARIDLGGDLRRLDDSGDEGRFNRDYDRGWASLVLLDRFVEGLDLTFTADSWDSEDRDIRTWGLDVTHESKQGTRVSLGSQYSLYGYDALLGRERDDVRVWYAKLRKKQGKSWTYELGYGLEDDGFDLVHVFLVGATWRF